VPTTDSSPDRGYPNDDTFASLHDRGRSIEDKLVEGPPSALAMISDDLLAMLAELVKVTDALRARIEYLERR
jgi:hypothetical protein